MVASGGGGFGGGGTGIAAGELRGLLALIMDLLKSARPAGAPGSVKSQLEETGLTEYQIAQQQRLGISPSQLQALNMLLRQQQAGALGQSMVSPGLGGGNTLGGL